MAEKRDYYEVLGVSKSASDSELKCQKVSSGYESGGQGSRGEV